MNLESAHFINMASVQVPQPVQHHGSSAVSASPSQQQVHDMYMVRSSSHAIYHDNYILSSCPLPC